jgi:hypothetical protein
MQRITIITSVILGLLSGTETFYGQVDASPPWCKSLAYHGGGYWTVRVPLRFDNHSPKVLRGEPVCITVSEDDGTAALIGKSIAGLRVADDEGVEFLFELENPERQRKRSGLLERGDHIILPVVADAGSTALMFLYAGNPAAWLPPDIRDFTDDEKRSERAVNEWLNMKADVPFDRDGIDIRIDPAEIRELLTEPADSSWITGLAWDYRVPICIRNFSNRNVPAGVITVNTRHVQNRIGKIYDFSTMPALYLSDPEYPDHPLDLTGDLSDHIRMRVRMAAMTEKTLWLYISKSPDVKVQSRFVNLFLNTRDHPDLEAYAGELEAREKQSWPIVAWVVNPLVKVFRQDIMPEGPEETVRVYASRNAYKSFQIALRSLKNLDVKITVSPLRNIHGELLPEPEVYKAGFVPVDFPVRYFRAPEISGYIRYYPERAGSDGWRDWWPDPLVPVEDGSTCKMEANNTQPFWFDLHVPMDATPGMYHGHVIMEYGKEKIYMPVHVKVWKLQLPDTRHISALYDLRTGPGRSPFGEHLTDAKGWSRFLAKYNTSPGMLSEAQPEFSFENGKVHMETKAFDEVVHFFIDELNINMLYTPGFFYSVHWYSGARPVFGLQPFSPAYVKAWKDAYSMFIDHITRKGWRKHFVLYLSDEPRIPLAFDAIARVADMAREVAPDVPIYVSSWDYVEEIAGHITAWGIGAQGQFPAELIRERKKKGDRFIYTTDGQQCLDTPFPATERLMPWFCYTYGAEAFEFWGSTWWTFNPWKYGWHAFIREGGGEEVKNPIRYPNGDGYVAYPGDEIGVGGPVPSIRLMAVREGVDDYEIFHALKPFAEQGERNAQEILEVVRSLVIVPNPGGMLSTSFMPDPDAVCHARVKAGEILDELLNQEIDP